VRLGPSKHRSLLQFLFDGTLCARTKHQLRSRIMFLIRLVCLLSLSLAAAHAQNSAPDSRMARADELLSAGKPQEALALLNEVAAATPDTPHLQAKIGKAYFQANQFQQAIPHLRLALQREDSDAESTQLLALCYFAVAEYAQALPLLEKLSPKLPANNADGPYLLASCYVMTNHWDEGRKTYAKLFSVPPDSAMAYLMFAKFLVRQRLEDRAVPEIQEALQRDPQIAMAHFLLGEIKLARGDLGAAVDELNKELAINPTVWLVYWRLGDAYVHLEKYDDAEKVLKRAIWLNDASSGPYILLGQVGLKQNDPAAAAEYLERANKLDPQNDYTHYFLAKAYQALGRTAEATQHFAIAKHLRNNKRADERVGLQSAQ
jgi:tetratricopeptide (TPR) repeat protein